MSLELSEKFISSRGDATVKVFEEDGGIIASNPIPEYYRILANGIEKDTIKTWIIPVDSIPRIIYAYDIAQLNNKSFTIEVKNELGTVIWHLELEYSDMVDNAGLVYYEFPLSLVDGGSAVTFESNVDLVSFGCIFSRCHIISDLGSLT